MDDDSNLDYEMEPQAALAGFHPSAEEAMDELNSEGMAMSEVNLRSEATDKSGIDVDFYDPASQQQTQAHTPALDAPLAPIETEEIVDVLAAPTKDPIAIAGTEKLDFDAVQALQKAATSADTHARTSSNAMGPDTATKGADQLVSMEHAEEAEEEVDELHPEEDSSISQNGAASATYPHQEDQPVSGGEVQPNGEENENGDLSGLDTYAQYDTEDVQDAAVRISFHGQDFVMWSAADIPSFLASAVAVDAVDPSDDLEEVVQIEAPALDVSKDVLQQPLDSLFAGLRQKSALGEFLDESHELHIAFPDLELDVAEDNLYCRELTLDDLLQLHYGLGLPTSLHIQVSERPRFITKYNELAQHVASLIGNELQHSSDDEEEAANSARPQSHSRKTANPLVNDAAHETNGLQAAHEAAAAAEQASGNGIISHAEADTKLSVAEASRSDVRGSATVPAGDLASDSSVSASLPLRSVNEASEQVNANHVGEAHESHATHPEEEDDEEAVDQLEGEREEEEDGHQAEEEHIQQEAEEHDQDPTTAATDGAVALASETEASVALSHDPAVAQVQGYEGEDAEEDDEGEEEEAEEEWAEEDEEALDEEEEGEGQEYEEEYAEEEEEEYVDEAQINGQDAEQTFYTTVNDSSEAEEDQLAEPDQSVTHDVAATHSVQEPLTAYADEAAEQERQWQGEEGEDQIVEYIEEPSEAPLGAASPASTTSSLYQTGAHRKRGLEDEDDNAEYEQDDYEAENKRVKVD
ncbi:hypothetical protein PSEUBRA_005152 [Kalmanozyma brasiliensis GHG001]|uniref:Uncharacterized protein n=1 Tax=Kalmanozyma brasiliensis (strain GHG001) TaxID=1365824 RepID=V5EKM0_KALBG|nr:uncharacterized protein PSEUBRA_005152 [Kalmanozyma brasiliensis GHG001]EST05470.1 hypothetical protein PSEUBRA_005152 [Kalmanozyma brasiliensis GHG001]